MGMIFPFSGVEAPFWLPPLVAFAISCLTSMAGVSGAFLLLPFQMSVLGFTSPAVSATNHLYNVVAIPGGVWQYVRQGRLLWQLVWVVLAATLPGAVVGTIVRVRYLPDPRPFKLFAGCVLLYLAIRLLLDLARTRRPPSLAGGGGAQVDHDASAVAAGSRGRETGGSRISAGGGRAPDTAAEEEGWRLEVISFDWRRLVFRFRGEDHSCRLPGVFAVALIVGVVGGIYGIGGGALMAPLLVSVFGLPVHAIAGAALAGTFVTSATAVALYQVLAASGSGPAAGHVSPDWLLGTLFGLGGLLGISLGARLQRRVDAFWIKLILTAVLLFISTRYIAGYLSG
jgi:uncharacterized membrane protein YfcA